MRKTLLILMLAVLGMACRHDETPLPEPQPQSPIKHVLLNEATPFYYLQPFEIDFNQDSLPDVGFSVGLEYSSGAEHTKFMAHSPRDGKMLLLQDGAVAYIENKEISSDVDLDGVVWGIQSGELLVKSRYESGQTVWSGSWESNPEGYLAVCFRTNGAYHYGWVKLLADVENDRIFIQEYAYSTIPNASIKTGQKE